MIDMVFLIFSIVLFIIVLGNLIWFLYSRKSKNTKETSKEQSTSRNPGYTETDTTMLVAMYTMYKETDKDQAEKIATELRRRGLKEVETDSEMVQWVEDDSSN